MKKAASDRCFLCRRRGAEAYRFRPADFSVRLASSGKMCYSIGNGDYLTFSPETEELDNIFLRNGAYR